MSNSKKKWWLALVVICCLALATFADQGQYQKPDRDHYPGRHGCEPQDDGCRPATGSGGRLDRDLPSGSGADMFRGDVPPVKARQTHAIIIQR